MTVSTVFKKQESSLLTLKTFFSEPQILYFKITDHRAETLPCKREQWDTEITDDNKERQKPQTQQDKKHQVLYLHIQDPGMCYQNVNTENTRLPCPATLLFVAHQLKPWIWIHSFLIAFPDEHNTFRACPHSDISAAG